MGRSWYKVFQPKKPKMDDKKPELSGGAEGRGKDGVEKTKGPGKLPDRIGAIDDLRVERDVEQSFQSQIKSESTSNCAQDTTGNSDTSSSARLKTYRRRRSDQSSSFADQAWTSSLAVEYDPNGRTLEETDLEKEVRLSRSFAGSRSRASPDCAGEKFWLSDYINRSFSKKKSLSTSASLDTRSFGEPSNTPVHLPSEDPTQVVVQNFTSTEVTSLLRNESVSESSIGSLYLSFTNNTSTGSVSPVSSPGSLYRTAEADSISDSSYQSCSFASNNSTMSGPSPVQSAPRPSDTDAPKPKKFFHRACLLFSIALPVVMAVFLNLGYFGNVDTPKPEPDSAPLEPPPSPAENINWMESPIPGYKFFSDKEVEYTGGTLYLVILGHVFNVSSGAKSYQPGSGYHGFIGKDATRAFVTGDFKDGLVSDISDLKPSDYTGLKNWLEFYINTYEFVGYLDGHFYTEEKGETKNMKDFKVWLIHAEAVSKAEGKMQEQFPPCNVEWNEKSGTTFWCSTKSGGIDRDWEGYVYQFKESPDKPQRCACISDKRMDDPRISPYPGCGKTSTRCKLKK